MFKDRLPLKWRFDILWRNPYEKARDALDRENVDNSFSDATIGMTVISSKRQALPLNRTRWDSVNKIAPLRWPYDLLMNLFNIYERGRYGYTYQDLYSVDSYLSQLIRAMLVDLIGINNGHPTSFESLDEWNDNIFKMVKGFDANGKLMDFRFVDEEHKAELEKEYDEGMELFKQHFNGLWD